jgi:hypothetical protein
VDLYGHFSTHRQPGASSVYLKSTVGCYIDSLMSCSSNVSNINLSKSHPSYSALFTQTAELLSLHIELSQWKNPQAGGNYGC